MRFRIENIEHTLRQIQHNEFLIRISKDPLKPNLRRSVAVGVLFVLESMAAGRCCLIKQQLSSLTAVVASNLHISFTNSGHLATSAAMESKKHIG